LPEYIIDGLGYKVRSSHMDVVPCRTRRVGGHGLQVPGDVGLHLFPGPPVGPGMHHRNGDAWQSIREALEVRGGQDGGEFLPALPAKLASTAAIQRR